MTSDVISALKSLGERARLARESGDDAAVAEVLREAVALEIDESQPAERELGDQLQSLASELVSLPEPAAIEELFGRALRAFRRATDVTVDDFLKTWNNLATLYSRNGAEKQLNDVLLLIGKTAESYEGALGSEGATVLMRMGDMYRAQGSFTPMLVMYRQVHRFMLSGQQIPDRPRAVWLQRYASALMEAHAEDTVDTVIEQAAATLEAMDDAPLSRGVCASLLAAQRETRGNWSGVAEAWEGAVAITGLAVSEVTEALSLAGRAWFKAGRYDAASRCYRRAIRRRAQLTN